MKTIGILFIGLAIVAFVYQGITITTKKKVLDAGPIEISRDDRKTLPLPPIAGVIFLVVGVGCLYTSDRRS